MGTTGEVDALRLDATLNLLKLIIMNDESAKVKIHEAMKDSCAQAIIFNNVKFRFYRIGYNKWDDCCDCWYTNEYFEYLNSNTADLELFDSVAENVRKGHCPHFDPDTPANSGWTGISLIHAVTAAGNKTVMKYLLTMDKGLKFCTTTAANLPPMIIAVLKNRAAMIKCLHVELDLSNKVYSPRSRFPRALLQPRYPNARYLNLSGMVVASRNAKDGKVTIQRILSPVCRLFGNPFAQIFYADADLNKSIIDSVRRYLNDEEIQMILLHIIYSRGRQEATNIVSNFSNHVSHFNADLVLECILWDNIEALDIILRKLKVETLTEPLSGSSFVYIAEVLNHALCARALRDYCERFDGRSKRFLSWRRRCVSDLSQSEHQSKTESSESRESPFYVILKLALQRGYDAQHVCNLLLKICTKRFNINHRNMYGMTPLHLCLECNVRSGKYLKAVLETLLGQGADPNIHDINGRSVLYSTLTPYNSPLGIKSGIYHVIGTMKSVLYHNAVPEYTPTAIHHAISRDKMNSFLRHIQSSSATVLLTKNSTNAKTIVAETKRDKFLAFSFVAILIELGFAVERSVIPQLTELPSELRQYVNETLCTPRSLQSRCRNIIRQTYPGPQLQRFLKVVHIPDVIADIILFQPYLLRTQICLASGTIIEDSDGVGF